MTRSSIETPAVNGNGHVEAGLRLPREHSQAQLLNDARLALHAIKSAVMHEIHMPSDDLDVATGTLASGHDLLMLAVPGTAKTSFAEAYARATGGKNRRLQGTPDVRASDITGYIKFNPVTGDEKFVSGPLHANVSLIDEVPRMTPKAQSGLLEAMQERQTTVDGATYPLPRPHATIGTGNLGEAEDGIYVLNDALRDRFLASIMIRPHNGQKMRDVWQTMNNGKKTEQAVDEGDLLLIEKAVQQVTLEEEVRDRAIAIVLQTRKHEAVDLNESVLGGQRPMLSILGAAAVSAISRGEGASLIATAGDVEFAAPYALQHRVGINFEHARNCSEAEVVQDAVYATRDPEVVKQLINEA